MKLKRIKNKDMYDKKGKFLFSQFWGNGWCFKCNIYSPKSYLQGNKRVVSLCDKCYNEVTQ